MLGHGPLGDHHSLADGGVRTAPAIRPSTSRSRGPSWPGWHVPTYRRYLASMYAWAGEMAIAADDLEMCIFSEQARLAGSQWA